jgi:hypothetical protein
VAIQQLLLQRRPTLCVDYSARRVFADAAVAVVTLTVQNTDGRPKDAVTFVKLDAHSERRQTSEIALEDLRRLPRGYISFPLNESDRSLLNLIVHNPNIASLAKVSDGATTAEAYEIRALVLDGSEASWNDPAVIPLVNTGTIDPFLILWGHKETAYLKGRFRFPVIPQQALRSVAAVRAMQAAEPKVLVGGMGSRIEAVADDGRVLCGKSAVLIRPVAGVCPYALSVLLNSTLVNRIYRGIFGSRGLGGDSMNIGPRQVELLPVPVDQAALRRWTGHDASALVREFTAAVESQNTARLGALACETAALSAFGKQIHRIAASRQELGSVLDVAESLVSISLQRNVSGA